MIRALAPVVMLAACASPSPEPTVGHPAPNPDAGGVGMSQCHVVSAAQFEAAPRSTPAAASLGGLSVTTTAGTTSCRTLDDGATACDYRGPGYIRGSVGDQTIHVHAPDDRLTTIVRSPAGLSCRQFGA